MVRFLFIFLFAISLMKGKGQNCDITDLNITLSDCNVDHFVEVTINFDIVNPGNDGFKIQGNGNVYGTYPYSALPVTLLLEGDCTTNYEIVVKDIQKPDCQESKLLGPICCNSGCHIYDLTVALSECDSNGYKIAHVNFVPVNPASDSFKVFGNGVIYGKYSYSQLPVQIYLSGNCTTNYEFVVADLENLNCKSTKEIGTICCNNSACSISNYNVDISDCQNDGTFKAKFSFKIIHPGSSGFKIQGNGKVYGEFQYNQLPVTLTLPGDCTTNYELVVKDIQTPDCKASNHTGVICCTTSPNCALQLINEKIGECSPSGVIDGYALGFDIIHSGDKGLGFDLKVNNKEFGFYKYSQLPLSKIRIEPATNAVDTITVCENDNANCCSTIYIHNPCQCNIYNVRSQVVECNNNTNQYYLRLNFNKSMVGDSFQVGGPGGFLGTFAYNKLPILLGPFNKSDSIGELLIADKNNIFCFDSYTPPPFTECQSCNIKDIRYEVSKCNDKGQIYVALKFTATNPGVKGFTIRGNGIGYGEYPYGKETYWIGPFTPDCNLKYEFVIIDNNNNNCQTSIVLNEKLCCSSCSFSSVKVTPICEGEPKVKVQYEGQSLGDSIKVWINDVFIGFQSTTQNPFAVNYNFEEGKVYTLTLQQLYHPDCKKTIEFKYTCNTDCGFTSLKATPVCEGSAKIKVQFEGQNVGDSIKVWINNNYIKTIASSQNPLLVEYEFKEGTVYILTLKNANHPDCKKTIEFKYTCVNNIDCGFQNIAYAISECNNDHQFSLKLKFTPVGNHQAKFKTKVNDQFFGPFEFGKDYYELGPINKACDGVRLEIWDIDNELCNAVVEIPKNYCCDENPSDCNIGSVKYEPICFENNIIGLQLLVNGKEGDGYYLYINDIKIGQYKYSTTPFLVNYALPQSYTVIKIVDIVNGACTKIIKPLLRCEGCTIYDLSALAVDCQNDQFKFKINFDTDAISSDSFYVDVNGQKFGKFAYNQLPVTLNQWYSQAPNIAYTLKVLDAEENCGLIYTVPKIVCVTSVDPNDVSINIFDIRQSLSQTNIHLFNNQVPHQVSIYSIDGRLVEKHSNVYEDLLINNSNINQLLVVRVENEKGIEVKKAVW